MKKTEIKTIEVNNVLYMSLQDIGNCIGCESYMDLLDLLDDTKQQVVQYGTLDAVGIYVNESAFYQIMLNSDNPNSPRFCKWLCDGKRGTLAIQNKDVKRGSFHSCLKSVVVDTGLYMERFDNKIEITDYGETDMSQETLFGLE